MRTLVFILLLFISNDGRNSCPCPTDQCCLKPIAPTQQCEPTPPPTPTPTRECREDINDCWLKSAGLIVLFSGAHLISGIFIHKYCNCGKYCSKENSNANDQNDIGMQRSDEKK
eukprot:115241_1